MRIIATGLAAGACMLVGCSSILLPRCEGGHVTIASREGDTVTTSTGLRYIDRGVGPGAESQWCRAAFVRYIGYLPDGTMFDYSPSGTAHDFAPGLNGVIDGVQQGVIGMRVGGTRRLIIPPALAFGADGLTRRGHLLVPPNTTVIYELDLIQVGE